MKRLVGAAVLWPPELQALAIFIRVMNDE